MNKAVFFDRDGVINVEPPYYAHKIEELKLVQNIDKAINLLNVNHFKVIVVSNQSGVARGYYTEKEVNLFNQEINNRLRKREAKIDQFYYCPHHPDGAILKYKINCTCRKPHPGMMFIAAKEHNIDLSKSYLIGNNKSDILAGQAAGCKTILFKSELEDKKAYGNPDYVCKDIISCIKIIFGVS